MLSNNMIQESLVCTEAYTNCVDYLIKNNLQKKTINKKACQKFISEQFLNKDFLSPILLNRT
jgi:hypothetical protein